MQERKHRTGNTCQSIEALICYVRDVSSQNYEAQATVAIVDSNNTSEAIEVELKYKQKRKLKL